ncbi:MAG: hypothetical protein ACXAD7_22110, partial [Candidatus Kariarchaeaceae archaeon]
MSLKRFGIFLKNTHSSHNPSKLDLNHHTNICAGSYQSVLAEFLKSATTRHLDETEKVIEQVTDEIIQKKPVEGVREMGEVVLHMIRSIEYYLQGLGEDTW